MAEPNALPLPKRSVSILCFRPWTATGPYLRSTATHSTRNAPKTIHTSTGETTIPGNQSSDKRASAIQHSLSSSLLPRTGRQQYSPDPPTTGVSTHHGRLRDRWDAKGTRGDSATSSGAIGKTH
jgi:hypothetical protein